MMNKTFKAAVLAGLTLLAACEKQEAQDTAANTNTNATSAAVPASEQVASPEAIVAQLETPVKTFNIMSEGTRVGRITKGSQKRNPTAPNPADCISFEAEMTQQLCSSQNSVNATDADKAGCKPWAFSVDKNRTDLTTVLNDAIFNQHKLAVTYTQYDGNDACHYKTDYVAVSIKDLSAKPARR